MYTTAIASVVFLATGAVASSVGNAHVVNKCKYQVHLCNTPASGGGYDQIDKVLNYNGEYQQQYTELSNGNGWSIKLSKDDNYSEDLLQYEYTFHNDGTIWYDLSQVDGNPWDGDWMITADGPDCSPKQQAYRYATDDAYGMQSCSQSANITVTLCSGEDQADGAASSASAAVESSEAASTTIAASSYGGSTAVASSPAPTTFAKVSALAGGRNNIVTEIVTAYETVLITATDGAPPHRHHPRHLHQRSAE